MAAWADGEQAHTEFEQQHTQDLIDIHRANVRDECNRILDEAAGHRYFHGCSNAIVAGTSPENVTAMLESCRA